MENVLSNSRFKLVIILCCFVNYYQSTTTSDDIRKRIATDPDSWKINSKLNPLVTNSAASGGNLLKNSPGSNQDSDFDEQNASFGFFKRSTPTFTAKTSFNGLNSAQTKPPPQNSFSNKNVRPIQYFCPRSKLIQSTGEFFRFAKEQMNSFGFSKDNVTLLYIRDSENTTTAIFELKNTASFIGVSATVTKQILSLQNLVHTKNLAFILKAFDIDKKILTPAKCIVENIPIKPSGTFDKLLIKSPNFLDDPVIFSPVGQDSQSDHKRQKNEPVTSKSNSQLNPKDSYDENKNSRQTQSPAAKPKLILLGSSLDEDDLTSSASPIAETKTDNSSAPDSSTSNNNEPFVGDENPQSSSVVQKEEMSHTVGSNSFTNEGVDNHQSTVTWRQSEDLSKSSPK